MPGLPRMSITGGPFKENIMVWKNWPGPWPSGGQHEKPQGMQQPGQQQKHGKGQPQQRAHAAIGPGRFKSE